MFIGIVFDVLLFQIIILFHLVSKTLAFKNIPPEVDDPPDAKHGLLKTPPEGDAGPEGKHGSLENTP